MTFSEVPQTLRACGLDVEYRKQRNQQLVLKNHREKMLLVTRRGELIEKKTAVMQAGYLLSAFRLRVLQEPSSLARKLVQSGVIEQKLRLEVEMMIKDDFCAMLERAG
jgi:Mut7-C RNAse domain